MVGESEGHGRSARLIASQVRRHREAQCPMRTDPVVLKELQVDESIEGWRPVWQKHGSCESEH
jgi:hypothetical protein